MNGNTHYPTPILNTDQKLEELRESFRNINEGTTFNHPQMVSLLASLDENINSPSWSKTKAFWVNIKQRVTVMCSDGIVFEISNYSDQWRDVAGMPNEGLMNLHLYKLMGGTHDQWIDVQEFEYKTCKMLVNAMREDPITLSTYKELWRKVLKNRSPGKLSVPKSKKKRPTYNGKRKTMSFIMKGSAPNPMAPPLKKVKLNNMAPPQHPQISNMAQIYNGHNHQSLHMQHNYNAMEQMAIQQSLQMQRQKQFEQQQYQQALAASAQQTHYQQAFAASMYAQQQQQVQQAQQLSYDEYRMKQALAMSSFDLFPSQILSQSGVHPTTHMQPPNTIPTQILTQSGVHPTIPTQPPNIIPTQTQNTIPTQSNAISTQATDIHSRGRFLNWSRSTGDCGSFDIFDYNKQNGLHESDDDEPNGAHDNCFDFSHLLQYNDQNDMQEIETETTTNVISAPQATNNAFDPLQNAKRIAMNLKSGGTKRESINYRPAKYIGVCMMTAINERDSDIDFPLRKSNNICSVLSKLWKGNDDYTSKYHMGPAQCENLITKTNGVYVVNNNLKRFVCNNLIDTVLWNDCKQKMKDVIERANKKKKEKQAKKAKQLSQLNIPDLE